MSHRNYSGWAVLDRPQLLADLESAGIRPRFANVVCEHVTHRYPDTVPAPAATNARVVGYVAGSGVEALIVEIDGSDARPDGGTYHLTFSLDTGHRPVESNAVIAAAKATGTVTAVSCDFTVEAF